MKVALGIIARRSESLLVLCLRPVISQFDALIMLSDGIPDWMDSARSLVHAPRQFHLFHYPWKHDYSDARNTLIIQAESLGFDWLLMLDADESMLPEDLILMRQYMETEESLIFPRYEFVDDFEHFVPWFYPDWQARAFRLNMGYHYSGKVHEQLCKTGNLLVCSEDNYSTRLPMCPIYHYGKSKTPAETWLKYENYPRIAAGQVPLTEVPAGTVMPESWALDKKKIRFLGNRPL